MQIIDHWVVPDWSDVFMESSALVVYLLFIIILGILYRKKYPLLKAKSITWILIAAVIGIIAATMNVFDEFVWFTPDAYAAWKITKSVLFSLSLIFLTYGFYLFEKLIKRFFE